MNSSTTVHIRSRRRLLTCQVALLTVVLGLLAMPPSPNSAFADADAELHIPNPWADQGLEVLGVLPNPWTDGWGSVDLIDQDAQLGYGFLTNEGRIGVYDMSTEIPTPVRVSETRVSNGAASRDTMVLDRDRNRLLLVGKAAGGGDRSVVDVVDLESLANVDTWDLGTALPGFVAYGFSLDTQRDRLFLVGEFMGNTNVRSALDAVGNNPIGPGPAIAALDPQDGSLAWVASLAQCHQVLRAPSGSLVGISLYQPLLYVFCNSGTALQQPIGQGGLVRLDISGEDRATGVADFRSEFFPVSGKYSGSASKTGITGFDPASERFFAQSLALRTPGAWVFDGLRDAWVGFIAAPKDTNKVFGLNTHNGRHYQAGGGGFNVNDGFITIADGRATPVPQGTLLQSGFPEREGVKFEGQITVDGPTGRLFVLVQVADPEGSIPHLRTLVLRDTTAGIEPPAPLDLDARTHDLDDDEAFLVYAAGATGFGARYIAVGGWEGIYSRIGHPLFAESPPPTGPNPANLSTGDRGMTFSFVPGADLRDSGASATAASSGVDRSTEADAGSDNEDLPGVEDVPVTFLAVTDQSVSCLDGAGEAVRQSEGGEATDAGFAEVLCDLEDSRIEARVRHGDDVVFPGLSTGSTSFETDAYRDPDGAAVTETMAIAERVFITDGSVEVFSIDRVTATLTVRADGRPGGTGAVWTRTIEGAAAPGGSQQSCTTTVVAGDDRRSSGDCDELERQINENLGSRIRVSFPDPSVVATPRGAFAQVRKSENDRLAARTLNNDDSFALPAMEIVYLNDHAEKSRMVVQYAAVNGYAQMVRTPLPGGGPDNQNNQTSGPGGAAATGSDVTQGSANPSGDSGISFDRPDSGGIGQDDEVVPPAPDVADPPPVAQEPAAVAGGWIAVTRAPKDAALVALLLAMFSLAPMEFARRRRLLAEIV